MQAYEFIAEYYRRLDGRYPSDVAQFDRSFEDVARESEVVRAIPNYRNILPKNKDARILDIGFGNGWFIATCVSLGYTHVEGADFGASLRQGIERWSPAVRRIHDITTDIATFLRERPESYDFIHFSHVIEHVPKYELFDNLDAIYGALRQGGTLMVRTPNMEGPRALSSRYIVLTHESGFTGAGLVALLEICNFDNVRFVALERGRLSVKQRIGSLARSGLIGWNRAMHRLFGAFNLGNQYGEEVILTAQRLDRPPLSVPARSA